MILEMAKKRKTVRKFKREKPPLEKLLKCLEAAKEAPSGMNAQPWRFVVVESQKKKSQIRKVCETAEKKFHQSVKGKLGNWLKREGFTWEKLFLEEAPYLIFVFARKDAPFSKESTWLAIGYLLLALEEEGLGTVPYTPPNPSDVAKAVDAPNDHRLEVILPVGYPADEKAKYERKPLEEIVSFESFAGFKDAE